MTLGQVLKLMRQHWPFGKRPAVLSGYRALGTQFQHTLADMGLRNYLFSGLPETDDALALARAAGRQDAVREIFELARVDAALIFSHVETKPTEPGR